MATFRLEAQEHLNTITSALLALERGPAEAERMEAIESVFRAVHTLKGAARSVMLGDIEARCQAMESVLSRLKGGRTVLTGEIVAGLQREARVVADLAAKLETAGPASTAAPAPTPGGRDSAAGTTPVAPEAPSPGRLTVPATIRLSADRLDALQDRAEELLAVKLAVEQRVDLARDLEGRLSRWRLADGPAAIEAARHARSLLDGLLRDHRALAAAVDGLHEETRRLRMMPAGSILEAFPGMVADLARARAKEADWHTLGTEIEVDRNVLESIRDPLLHLVRNAIDHGIETPAARKAAGKPGRGRVSVAFAALEGRQVEVRVEDDGAGIDLGRVRAAAARARLGNAQEMEALTDDAALELLFASGLSTSAVITDLSGHGLGMAIVKDRVERLGGRVRVETRAGAGTTVRMTVPATVATFRGLLVRAGLRPVLLPLASVQRVLRVSPADVQAAGGTTAIRHEGGALPVGELAAVLGWAAPAPGSGKRPCVVVQGGDERAGFFVEEVLGEREVLVKEMAPPLLRVRHVAAGGLIGTGELALILRPEDLVPGIRELSASASRTASVESTQPAAILVVDDSITTRTMERNLLEAAGYHVEVAADGIEAWAALKTRPFDLVVSDVDMPRLDGFGLTARIRSEERLSDLPVVLVTALESREDRERGVEVGANAYVIKSGFDQSKLLEIIQRLV
ncbi:MAG TPA: response regulator [Vicinamibacteria bacterium]|nr:response regulator [Vicinamibacteria bacterium]